MARIVRKSIYNLLSHLCDYFDNDGSCSRHFFIYELLSELLSGPNLAKEFCSSEGKFIDLQDIFAYLYNLENKRLSV